MEMVLPYVIGKQINYRLTVFILTILNAAGDHIALTVQYVIFNCSQTTGYVGKVSE